MSKRTKRVLPAVLILGLAVITCNLPSAAKGPVLSNDDLVNTAAVKALTVQAGAAPSPTGIITTVIVVQPTAAPISTQCSPLVTANTDVNVRSGPGTAYDVIGYLPTGATALVAGRNDAQTWWYIQFAGGYGGYAWVAGSVTTPSCIPAVLQVVAAPPLPTAVPPTKTEKVTSPPLLIVTAFLPPLVMAKDIQIVEVFLSTHREVVVRVAVKPTNSLSGPVTYKVWVDGSLKATKTESLPAGSAAYWSGVTISGSHTVRVKIDTGNQYDESNEGNNDVTVTCDGSTLDCN
jgi:hypothetical protein